MGRCDPSVGFFRNAKRLGAGAQNEKRAANGVHSSGLSGAGVATAARVETDGLGFDSNEGVKDGGLAGGASEKQRVVVEVGTEWDGDGRHCPQHTQQPGSALPRRSSRKLGHDKRRRREASIARRRIDGFAHTAMQWPRARDSRARNHAATNSGRPAASQKVP